jgi:hypothetical protein
MANYFRQLARVCNCLFMAAPRDFERRATYRASGGDFCPLRNWAEIR